MELRGIESAETSTSEALESTEKQAANVTVEDAKEPPVSASVPDVEDALARALTAASAAGQWDVVAQLAKELEARRLARAGNVIALDARKRGGR